MAPDLAFRKIPSAETLARIEARANAVDWRLLVVLGPLLSAILSPLASDIDTENNVSWFHAKLFLEEFRFNES